MNGKKASFRVGDRVKFAIGLRTVVGVVEEDRGPLGYQGERLYRVRAPRQSTDDLVAEIPEDELQPAE